MKVFNIIFVILFILFALLQYNDPDPYLWIPIYLYGSLMCWMSYRGKPSGRGLIAGILVYVAYAVYLFFEDNGVLSWIRDHNAEDIAATMHAEKPWIEDAREFFGLAILVAVLAINYWRYKKRISHKINEGP
jgi:transmembrane protein TMEM220